MREIKKYKHYELEEVGKNLSARNKKLIKEFLAFCATTAGKSKLRHIEGAMVKTAYVMGCSLDKITLPKLREFLALLKESDLKPPTKNEIRKQLKRFIKEFYSDWNTRFKGLKDIKLEKEVNREKINSNTLLSEKDVERLIRAVDGIQEKAIILILFELAGRPEEIAKLRWKDINLEKSFLRLFSSKTGEPRELPFSDNVKQHLLRLQRESPFIDRNNDDFLFPSDLDRNKHIYPTTINHMIKVAGNSALGRHIFPYLLRHSRLKLMQKKLPASLYEQFAGHSIKVANEFYNHMDIEDLKEVLRTEVYEVKELSEDEKDELVKLREKVNKLTEHIKRTDVVNAESIRLQKEIIHYLKKVSNETNETGQMLINKIIGGKNNGRDVGSV